MPTPQYGLAFTHRPIPTKLVQAFADVCRETLKSEEQAKNYYVSLQPEHLD